MRWQEKKSPSPTKRSPTAIATDVVPSQDASGDFVISAIASAIGGGATWATFATADPGGTFYVLWGPTIVGAWKLLQGIVRYIRYPTVRGLVLGLLAFLVLAAAGLALGIALSESETDTDSTVGQNDLPGADIPVLPPGETSIFDLEAGDCLSEAALVGELGSVRLVPCESPEATHRVSVVFDVPTDGSYPGVYYFDGQAADLCPIAAEWYLHPTEQSWAEGDRQITCLRTVR